MLIIGCDLHTRYQVIAMLNSETGDRVLLRGNHVFGRNALRSDTVLPDPEASLLHAVLRWRDSGWLTSCAMGLRHRVQMCNRMHTPP